MLVRNQFARDFTSKVIEKLRLRWLETVNDEDDIQALGQLIDKIGGNGKSNEVTSYLGALELVMHGKSAFVVCSLRNSGIYALRRLFQRADPLHKSLNGLGPGLGILDALINSSIEVRNCLLDHWAAILRPVKHAFSTVEKIVFFDKYNSALCANVKTNKVTDERIDAFYNEILPRVIHDPRVFLNGEEVLTFSDYLRNLELHFMLAPDSTAASVDRISTLNTGLLESHICFRDVQSLDQCTVTKELPGPRLGFTNTADRYGLKPSVIEESMDGDLALSVRWNLNALRLNSIRDLIVSEMHDEIKSLSIHRTTTKRNQKQHPLMSTQSAALRESDMPSYRTRATTMFRFATSTEKVPEVYTSTENSAAVNKSNTINPDQSTNNTCDKDVAPVENNVIQAPDTSRNNAVEKKKKKGTTAANIPGDPCDCKPGGRSMTLKARVKELRKRYSRETQKRLSESETVAHCSTKPRHLKNDPRQSRRFRKAVKPLVDSLNLPESQKEAVAIVYRGYETVCRFSKAAIATGDYDSLSSVTKHCFVKGLAPN